MGKRNVGNVIEIMKSDFKSVFSNPIVTILLLGLIILPSLYALINIQACWNPYENTGDVEFAIANMDNGSSFDGTPINVGNELVQGLDDNDKFKWTFVTEEELRRGVHDGDYYAGIIIPKNLTENVLSIAGDNPQQAKLEYLVNMKANPVGAKLSDSASNAVYLSLNAKIVEFINMAAYGKLGELQEGLSSGATQLASGGSQLSAGADQVSSGASQVSDGATKVQKGSKKLESGVSEVDKGSKKVEKGAQKVKEGSKKLESGSNQVQSGSDELQSVIDPSLMPDNPVKDYIENSAKVAEGSGEVAQGASKLADGSVTLAKGSSKLANGSSTLANGANTLANGSSELAKGSLALAAGSQMLSGAAAQALFTAAGALASSADSLSGITGINETLLGDYFYSPIKLDRHEIFPVPNYGSQIAPFYLVLSMWVGALITCAMLKPGTSEGTKYTPLEMYFGKLALFLVMSIFQGCVTIIGSFILGIYVAEPLIFIVSAILVSGVFMVLMYSFVSALGDVGKAIGILLLLFQISGTNGIYPIQIMDYSFQVVHPYLPMTYAITLIRESQLGMVWSNYLPALAVLLAIGLATVIILLIVKEKADKPTHYFEKRLEDSGLF